MVSGWHRYGWAVLAALLLATPSAAGEAFSRAVTVRNVPDVPSDPITQAWSRPMTVYSLPDVPPLPVTAAVSRAVTVRNLPDVTPAPVTHAFSRAVTVHALPESPPTPITAAYSRPITVSNRPDPPPPPITAAVSRPMTVRNQPDVPPAPITAAYSRPLTVRVDPAIHAPPDRPAVFALHGARPNPFNPSTTILFEVPRETRVWISIYNVRGALVATLMNGVSLPPGPHEAVWHGSDGRGRSVASGVYLCRMTADGFDRTVPLTLVK
jgi:hypothetical protein